MTVKVLWLFLMVPWVGMQCVIVVLAVINVKKSLLYVLSEISEKYTKFWTVL